MRQISLTVNGKLVTVAVDPATLLSELLRDTLRLTGTHIGCDTSQCGACTVHVDGRSIKSCSMLAVEAEARDVLTIEGVAVGARLHPMQQAFHENHALQCGFCTPGMIMSALDLAATMRHPTVADIRHWLEGNICRCTGYQNIVKAVQAGAAAMHGSGA